MHRSFWKFISGTIAAAYCLVNVTGCGKIQLPHGGGGNSKPDKIVTVSDCNLNGWVKQQNNGNSVHFIDGPASVPFSKGTVQFSVVNTDFLVRLRDTSYNGVKLADLTELKFSTYVQQLSTDTIDTPFIVLQVDTSNDGKTDFRLLYVPRYQNGKFPGDKLHTIQTTKFQTWQTWDALDGAWWNEEAEPIDPDFGGTIHLFKNIIKEFPNGKIVNDASGGGVRLSAGSPFPRWSNFLGSVNAMAIGVHGKTTLYDFEPSDCTE